MFFRDIPGKEKEKRYLIESVNRDRTPHANLFLGRSGSGQLALALAFASYLMCNHRTETDSCGACPACTKTHKFIHPDIHFTFPVIKKDGKLRKDTTSTDFQHEWRSLLAKNPFFDIQTWTQWINAENSQANINVKECFDIIHKLSLKTFESDTKVLILWMPEYLRGEGNRLLKIIEEPTDNTIIILVAENQEEILNTILSRTQLLKVSNFADREIIDYLVSNYNLPPSDGDQLAALADGSLNTAIHLADQEVINYSEALFKWLRIAYKLEPVEIGKWVTEMAKWGREYQKNFLEYGLHFFREYLFWLLTGSDMKRLNAAEKKTAENMAKMLDTGKTENIISVLNDAIGAVSRNANPKILFMNESLNIGRIMRKSQSKFDIYNT